MHDKALEKIERKIIGSLKNCSVTDNWPRFESFSDHVDSLAEEVLKHKKEWISYRDVYSIFYDLVYEATKQKAGDDQKLNGGLWDLLGASDAEKLAAALKNFFISIPRDYDVYIPIPKIAENLKNSLKLSDNASLVIFKDAKEIPGGYSPGLLGLYNVLEPNKVYFRYSVKGYCSRNLENYSLRKVVSNFKIIIQQGFFRELFIEGQPAGLGLFGGLAYFQIPKAKLVSVDKTAEEKHAVDTELPLEVSRFLDRININWSVEPFKTALDKGEVDKVISHYLRLASLLMENSAEEARRVKSAIEWCFDSYAAENQTMSFLQTCIGLEALLGDDDSSGSLTEILADRCAYLIGTDIKGRKTIKQNFKELYKIRSKLVHGVEVFLTPDQKGFLNWGKSVLEHSINREMKHLNLDKT